MVATILNAADGGESLVCRMSLGDVISATCCLLLLLHIHNTIIIYTTIIHTHNNTYNTHNTHNNTHNTHPPIPQVDRDIKVGGWVRTGRTAGAGAFAFLEVNDGSCFASLQALVTVEVANTVGGFGAITNTGTSVLLQGQLTKTPEGTKQVYRVFVVFAVFVCVW